MLDELLFLLLELFLLLDLTADELFTLLELFLLLDLTADELFTLLELFLLLDLKSCLSLISYLMNS